MEFGRRTGVRWRAAEARRIRDLLRVEVLHRGLDERLLPEDRLMARFGVSRAVVRDALELLRSEGLVERIQGVGTRVCNTRTRFDLAEYHGAAKPSRGSALDGRISAQILDWRVLPLPDVAAEALGLAANRPGLRVDYVGWCDHEPFVVATNYVRMPEALGMEPELFRKDWYRLLEESGITLTGSTLLMEASLADRYDAELLGVEPGAPVLLYEQVIFGADEVPFNFALVRARGDRSVMFSRARRENPGPAG
ncbi:GntR family transcriptional regulator [Streptomyces sp. NPDC050560]|uniref:GntR family transcriptional regulator n=1 Tax=Streptomyces sp. NPDC050560 TaxID=3365630 RepID=UPI0037999B86